MFARSGLLAGLLVCVPGLVHAQNAAPQLPEGEGREIVQRVCTSCHSLVPVLMKRDGEGGWRHTVTRMVLQRQAQLLPEEFETVVRYLSTRVGPGTNLMQTGVLPPGSMAGGAATAKEVRLPDGPGREIVQARCSLCHDLGRVVSVRRTKEEWDSLTRNMIGRGPQASEAQVQTLISYFTTNFLERPE
jgi:cytochrome c5